MPKKKVEVEEEEDWEDDSLDEEVFTCRLCKKDFEAGNGDDYLLMCDDCIDKYDVDVDKIWNDYDKGKIDDDNLTSFDVKPYAKKMK